jgi:hypothetical protein
VRSVVARDAEIPGQAARAADLAKEHGAIAVSDLSRSRALPGAHKLVTG